jgi:5-methylcytosine-specific restriction endonuclease McrA
MDFSIINNMDTKFKKGQTPWNKGKKHTNETKRKISLKAKLRIGDKNPFYGKKHSEEARKKMSENNKRFWKGKHRSKETIEQMRKGQIGKPKPKHTQEWKERAKLWMNGKKNCNWKGGVSRLNIYRHYKNSDYKNWREGVFKRDDYTCLNCGVRGVYLHPHHIKSYTYYPEYRYNVDNGITLCVPCHHQLHFGN